MEQRIVLTLGIEDLKNLHKETLSEVLGELLSKQNKEQDILLSRKEAAKFLKISLPTLSKHTKSGKIKPFCVGKRVLYRKEDLLEAFKQSLS